MIARFAPRNWPAVVRWILVPWAAAAVVGFVWTAVRVHTFAHFLPIALAILAGIAVLALPMPKWVRMAAGLGLGVAVRLLAHGSIAGGQLHGDAIYNVQLAANLLAGKGLTVGLPGYGPDIRGMYPPVYILALAGMLALGGSALLLNLIADLAAAAALYRLSLGRERVAVAYFLFPSVVLSSIIPVKKALAMALMLIAMCLVRRPLAFGAMTGLVALTQPAWTPVPLVAFAILERRPAAIGWAALGAVAVLMPWWVRNAIVFGQFVPLTTSPGLSLWVAVFGTYEAVSSAPMNEVAMSAETGRAALAAIWAHPAAYLSRIAGTAPFTLALNSEMTALVGPENAPWVAASANACNAAWAGLLAWAAARRAEVDRRWLAFAGGWLVGISIGMWFEFSPRHRAFAVPLLLLWIGAQRRRTRTDGDPS